MPRLAGQAQGEGPRPPPPNSHEPSAALPCPPTRLLQSCAASTSRHAAQFPEATDFFPVFNPSFAGEAILVFNLGSDDHEIAFGHALKWVDEINHGVASAAAAAAPGEPSSSFAAEAAPRVDEELGPNAEVQFVSRAKLGQWERSAQQFKGHWTKNLWKKVRVADPHELSPRARAVAAEHGGSACLAASPAPSSHAGPRSLTRPLAVYLVCSRSLVRSRSVRFLSLLRSSRMQASSTSSSLRRGTGSSRGAKRSRSRCRRSSRRPSSSRSSSRAPRRCARPRGLLPTRVHPSCRLRALFPLLSGFAHARASLRPLPGSLAWALLLQERDAEREAREEAERKNAALEETVLQFQNQLQSVQKAKQEVSAEHDAFLQQFSRMSTEVHHERAIAQEQKRVMQGRLQNVAAERDLLRYVPCL